MYGLKVVQYRRTKSRPPYCAFPYRLLDKIVHYSKMSKTRKSPRKSFTERWEPSQKRAGTVFPHLLGKWCMAVRPFSGHTIEAAPYRPIGAYSVLPQTGSGSRWHIQPSEFRTFVLNPSVPFYAAIHHACEFFSHHARKSRAERRARRHRSIYRTWAGVEHFPRTHICAPFSGLKHLAICEYGK